MFKDVPLVVLATTVCTYWGTIVLLVLYKRLRHGRSAGVTPRDAFERRLWLLLVPVVVAWICLPFFAGKSRLDWLALPSWAQEMPAIDGLRWVAAGLALTCYLLSLYCWLLMGRNWSMAIVPGQTSQLVTAGMYRWVRHPIYSLSVALMLLSVIVAPTVAIAVLACLHLIAMNLKARHEEQFLQESFGVPYVEYCRQVGRFWPRWYGSARCGSQS